MWKYLIHSVNVIHPTYARDISFIYSAFTMYYVLSPPRVFEWVLNHALFGVTCSSRHVGTAAYICTCKTCGLNVVLGANIVNKYTCDDYVRTQRNCVHKVIIIRKASVCVFVCVCSCRFDKDVIVVALPKYRMCFYVLIVVTTRGRIACLSLRGRNKLRSVFCCFFSFDFICDGIGHECELKQRSFCSTGCVARRECTQAHDQRHNMFV